MMNNLQMWSVWIKCVDLGSVRALLSGWAAWKQGSRARDEYLSPPNVIWRLMTGDVGNGGNFGSSPPRGVVKHRHNIICQRLDNLINELPEAWRKVIHCEFLTKGTQQQKANNLNIAYRTYKLHLNSSIKQIIKDEYIQNLIQSI